jgi:hypothetical protein
MPFDTFFQSEKRKGKAREWRKVAAKHKRSWPKGSQYQSGEKKVSLLMRPGRKGHEDDPWPFLWVGVDEAERELRAWRKANPGTLFWKGPP